MLKLSRLAALLIASAVVSSPLVAAEKTKAAFTVNGQAVSQNAFDAFIAERKAQGEPDVRLEEKIREELIQRELFAQEAKKKGLDKNGLTQGQIEMARQALLARAFMIDYIQTHPVSDSQLKAQYETIKTNLGATEYKSRHILVEKEDEATVILTKLDKGEKFAELAKQSKDPGTKDKGGELGWSSPAVFVPAFGEALSKLKKGEYTRTPVATQFGFHVILLEDTRPTTLPDFEQVKPQLQERAAKETIDKLIADLRAKAKIGR